MGHVVLLGDSIFDNAVYVSQNMSVVEQLRTALPSEWTVTLLAEDGAMADDVARQIKALPQSATHVVVSVGGNDALSVGHLLQDVTHSSAEGFAQLSHSQGEFRRDYSRMLDAVLATGNPLTTCTVYDACPGIPPVALTGLSAYNDVILHESIRRRLPILELRLVCDEAADFSEISPIEPSAAGGAKIAASIHRILSTHDFSTHDSVVYGAA